MCFLLPVWVRAILRFSRWLRKPLFRTGHAVAMQGSPCAFLLTVLVWALLRSIRWCRKPLFARTTNERATNDERRTNDERATSELKGLRATSGLYIVSLFQFVPSIRLVYIHIYLSLYICLHISYMVLDINISLVSDRDLYHGLRVEKAIHKLMHTCILLNSLRSLVWRGMQVGSRASVKQMRSAPCFA